MINIFVELVVKIGEYIAQSNKIIKIKPFFLFNNRSKRFIIAYINLILILQLNNSNIIDVDLSISFFENKNLFHFYNIVLRFDMNSYYVETVY